MPKTPTVAESGVTGAASRRQWQQGWPAMPAGHARNDGIHGAGRVRVVGFALARRGDVAERHRHRVIATIGASSDSDASTKNSASSAMRAADTPTALASSADVGARPCLACQHARVRWFAATTASRISRRSPRTRIRRSLPSTLKTPWSLPRTSWSNHISLAAKWPRHRRGRACRLGGRGRSGWRTRGSSWRSSS